jgi:hypothetical protein
MENGDEERRMLEAAGWEPQEREDGETVWKNPANDLALPPSLDAVSQRRRRQRVNSRSTAPDAPTPGSGTTRTRSRTCSVASSSAAHGATDGPRRTRPGRRSGEVYVTILE